MKKILFISIILFFTSLSSVQAIENLPLHLKIMSTHNTVEPQIWKNTIFLTARPRGNPRFVGVAFDFESYGIIHPFKINESGIFIYTAQAPEMREIHYRLIIDGLWMADPLGVHNERDKYGIMVSKLEAGEPEYVKVKGPESDNSGNTTFSIRSRPDSTVSIVGTFNGWDPYMTSLKESFSGVYSTNLRLKKGTYFYYFIIDGRKAMDPMNFSRAMNREGEEVCQIVIP